MIESFVLIEEDYEDVYKNYIRITGSTASEINELFIICDDMKFENRNNWCLITLLYGDAFGEEILLQLARTRLVYCYSDDTQMDCEFLVARNSKVIRKKYIYAGTPELNEDEGLLQCELNKKFIYWNDIDFFAQIAREEPKELFY